MRANFLDSVIVTKWLTSTSITIINKTLHLIRLSRYKRREPNPIHSFFYQKSHFYKLVCSISHEKPYKLCGYYNKTINYNKNNEFIFLEKYFLCLIVWFILKARKLKQKMLKKTLWRYEKIDRQNPPLSDWIDNFGINVQLRGLDFASFIFSNTIQVILRLHIEPQ